MCQVWLRCYISILLSGWLVGWSAYFITCMMFLVKVLDVSPGFNQHPVTHPKLCKSTPGDLYHSLAERQKLRQMIVPKKTNDGEKDWTPILMYTSFTPVWGRPLGKVLEVECSPAVTCLSNEASQPGEIPIRLTRQCHSKDLITTPKGQSLQKLIACV